MKKTPDKIYLAESDDIRGEVVSNYASSTPFRIHDSIAYIRKDALLEWAKEKDLSSVLHHPDRHYILAELIKKIESL